VKKKCHLKLTHSILIHSFIHRVALLSGQKSRVSFAALAYQRPHLLIIDEGSNHLSMDAVDALIQAVQEFKGKKSERGKKYFAYLT